MNNFVAYVKTIFLSVCLFAESLILGDIIIKYVESKSYFSISQPNALQSIFIMLLILITFSLTTGAWNEWLQYIIVPLPIGAAIVLITLRFNVAHAILAGCIASLLLVYDIYLSTRIKNMLIKFAPRLILRFTVGGILLVFSVFAGLIVILHTTDPANQINIGEIVSDYAKEPVKNVISNQLKDNVLDQSLLLENQEMIDVENLDPVTRQALEQMGYGDVLNELMAKKEALTSPDNLVEGINIEGMIKDQINSLVAPYRNFIRPLVAVLAFGLYQLYAAIAAILFYLIVDGIYWAAKKTRFFKVEKITVEKELLKF